MDSEEILGLYAWAAGSCFQCAQAGTDTTVVGVLRPKGALPQEIRACKVCLLLLESERQQEARRRGTTYEPGHIGPSARVEDHDCSEPARGLPPRGESGE